MSTAELFNLDAEVGSEEDDESFGEDGQKPKKTNGTNGHFDDSSDEEEDDEDEEAAARIREGFIVDEDEEEDDEEQRQRRRKRRREERKEDEVLDDEDLELIGDIAPQAPSAPKYKRLKRGHRAGSAQEERVGVENIFADDNEDFADEAEDRRYADRGLRDPGEFDDFIEEDEFSGEEREQMIDEEEVSRRPKGGLAAIKDLQSSGLDEAGMEDMRAAFGDGTEYDWALELQEAMDEEKQDPDKPLELKDVFEPSQLAEKMLTDEDNLIRNTDVPERLQIAWKPFDLPELTEEEFEIRNKEEATWISNMMVARRRLDEETSGPFRTSVGDVLRFVNWDKYEVPFIFQHRKDYLIHSERIPLAPDPNNPQAPEYETRAEKLLLQSDLWEIMEHDLKYKALVEKREALEKAYENLKSVASVQDSVVEDLLPQAVTMEEIQDIQDYLHFQYSAELKDINVMQANITGAQKRARASTVLYEKIRAGKTYRVVRGFGVSPDAFAQSALEDNARNYIDDPTISPDDMADECIDADEFSTGSQVLRAAKSMLADEFTFSPRMRKFMRQAYFLQGLFDCVRTEKGLRKIDEDHPYYEFKYLRNQSIRTFQLNPELYLKMLEAEQAGLVEIDFRIEHEKRMATRLYKILESDNFSEVADAWNNARRDVLDIALAKMGKMMMKSVKENLKSECENFIARACRAEYSKKLDQAPYKPKGMVAGTSARVLSVTNGKAIGNKEPYNWAWVEEDGRFLEKGEWSDLRLGNPEKALPEGRDVASFVEIVERRKPDVIVISGFNVDTKTLHNDLKAIVEQHNLQGTEYEDDEGLERRDKIEVILVNDETARLYHDSDRSKIDYPGLKPMTKYCIALAKYVQNPMKEYAALRTDITSIIFDSRQSLIPQEKLLKHLETAMVDMVNLVGVEVNDAISDPATQNLLPYVCGLGVRKAQALVQAVNRSGGTIVKRDDLVGDPTTGRLQAVTPKVWENCASFLYIQYDATEPESDYLDNTRVHPEDYELGRKMAADALDLDEEDVAAETDEGGQAAVVRKLVRDEAQDKVNELILESYAEQLEERFKQRKRATLETIRAELQQPYEELRRNFALLSSDEVFTMLTGETQKSLAENMIVPVIIRRVFPDHLEVKLDCGVEGGISESEFPSGVGMDGVEPRTAFQVHQTVQAKITFLNRKQFTAQLSLREDALKRALRRDVDRDPGEWDDRQEDADKREVLKRKEDITGRVQRVIKHPLFRPFNATQAEEFLGPQGRGDVVVRPSSKGLEHLAVTWKVSDNVFQHIDVLELDKENEFSVGRTLKIGGKYTYSDLDELIVNHVKAMAKKVDEIMTDERYQTGSKAQTEAWLTAYMEANPRRSMYAFCINREFPGYFYLCFKASQHAKHNSWPVKVIPNAFELQKNPYPDVRALKNGFKTMFANMQQQNGRRR